MYVCDLVALVLAALSGFVALTRKEWALALFAASFVVAVAPFAVRATH